MEEEFKYLFEYCNIPKDGQDYILTSPEVNRNAILEAFKLSPYRAKYCYFPILVTRFIFNDDNHQRLYHYLDHRNFEKILASRTYLAGYQHEMNDSTEGKYSWDKALSILKTMSPSPKLLKLFQKESNVEPFDYYFMSFTQNNSNQALQNYGDMAFEIKPHKLLKILMEKYFPDSFTGIESMKAGNAYSFVVNVIYDEEIQEEYLRNTLNIWKSAYELQQKRFFNYATMNLHFYSLIFKPWKYHQEEEVRFLISKIVDEKNESYETKINGKRKIKVPIDNEMLTSVIVNHAADRIDGEDINSVELKIKNMLKENNFTGVSVKKTDLEY